VTGIAEHLIATLAPMPTLAADSPGFAEIFFLSRRADGGLDWVGSGMIWLLVAMSLVNVSLIALRASADRRSRILPEGRVAEVRELVERDRFREAIALVGGDASDFGRMLAAAFAKAPSGHAEMVRTVEQRAEELVLLRFRSLEWLNILGQVSPMIGLFGTVYGMIVAFQTIASSGGAADPAMLAGGIGTALVTTFWGLVIAIPALAAYATLRNQVDATSREAEDAAIAILAPFQGKAG